MQGRMCRAHAHAVLLLAVALSGCGTHVERDPTDGNMRILGGGDCAEPAEVTHDITPLGWSRTVGELLAELETAAVGQLVPVDGAPVDAELRVAVIGDSPFRMRFTEDVDGRCRGILVTDLRLDMDAGDALDVPSLTCLATVQHDTAAICAGDVRMEDVLAPSSPDDVYQGLSVLAWGRPEGDPEDDWRVEIDWTEDVYLTSMGRSPEYQMEPLGRLFANRE